MGLERLFYPSKRADVRECSIARMLEYSYLVPGLLTGLWLLELSGKDVGLLVFPALGRQLADPYCSAED